MVQDNPNMHELEELMEFCASHRPIYLFDHGEPQRLVAKYLCMAGISVSAYLVPEIMPDDRIGESIPVRNLYTFRKTLFSSHKAAGVILTVADYRNTQVIDMLSSVGFQHLYVMSEWNKRTIPHKMRPRSRELFLLEVNLADHCNLNCQCCDHFSPLAEPTFMDFNQYVRDINRLAELTDHSIGLMKLQGGSLYSILGLLTTLKLQEQSSQSLKFAYSQMGFFSQNGEAKWKTTFGRL